MQRKEQNEKEKERKQIRITQSLSNYSLSEIYLTKENNDFCQMSSQESWLCSVWKQWVSRILGSLEMKTTSGNITRWSSILFNNFLLSSSVRHTHHSRPKTPDHISFIHFYEILLLLVSTHRSSLKCSFMSSSHLLTLSPSRPFLCASPFPLPLFLIFKKLSLILPFFI